MTYFLNLFTPETWQAFQEHGATISGFRHRQRKTARERVEPGDVFLCYLVRLSRWCGILQITSKAFIDDTPIYSDPDPFVVRFQVRSEVVLEPERSIPITEDRLWNYLSITKGTEKGVKGWAVAHFRSSLREIDADDGKLIDSVLREQGDRQLVYPFTDRDRRQLTRSTTVRTPDREVAVEVPGAEPDDEEEGPEGLEVEEESRETRTSIHTQAKIAQIGAEMGFRIWVPRNDRSLVQKHVPEEFHGSFLAQLPLNYDDTTLRTIEQIDVIWLKGRAMSRAFEVEHTTAIYSGLLRMADLLALQPNMAINLHIVAPDEKREKVMREIKRPVFSLLEHGPLYEKCTFLSYDAIDELVQAKHLGHMSDTIIEEYEEAAEN
jgi:hypothetical protein